MKEQEQFDELIRSKLESRRFTPGENSWEDAQRLIDAQQGRRSRRRLLFAAALALLITGSAAVWLASGKNGPGETAQQHSGAGQNANAGAGNENASPGDANVSGNENNSANENANASSGNESAAGKTGAGSANANPNAGGDVKTAGVNGSNKAGTNAGTNNAGSNAQQNDPGAAAGKQPGNNRSTSGKNTQANAAQNKNAGTAPRGSNGKNKQSSSGTSGTAGQRGNDWATGGSSGGDPKRAEDRAGIAAGTHDVWEENAGASGTMKNTPNDKGAGSSGASSDSVSQPVAAAAASGDPSQDPKAALAATSDSTSASTAPLSTTPSAQNPLPSKGYWFARGGVAYMPGFTSDNGSGRSLNPVIGGGYSYGFGSRCRVEASLQYTSIGNASDSSRIYTAYTYSFGSDLARTEIGLKRLHYVALPLHFRVSVNAKNAFLAGITPHYLVSTESKERTYTQRGTTILDDKTKTVFGYAQGIRSFDALLSAGYARSLGERWDLVLLFNYGLGDVKFDDRFALLKKERHKNLQLQLHYSF